MAITDWNTANANRYYPFITNTDATQLDHSEILDARFFIVNPTTTHPTVWLDSKVLREGQRIYTFKNSDGDTLEFVVPDSRETQCIWNSTDKWNGYCVFGPSIED